MSSNWYVNSSIGIEESPIHSLHSTARSIAFLTQRRLDNVWEIFNKFKLVRVIIHTNLTILFKTMNNFKPY